MDDPLTDEQLATFERTGHVRVPAAFSPDAALRIQERMWDELREDFGIDRDARRTFELHRNADSLGGLFVFTFFSRVEDWGGGTLIVEGSHRLLRQFHADLSPETRDVRGVPVRVVELTGEPGDAILCHPLILHAAAPNRRESPRFMRSQRICEDPA